MKDNEKSKILKRLTKVESSWRLSQKYTKLLEESNEKLDEKILELELFNEIAKIFSSSAFDRWNIAGFLFKVIRKKLELNVLALILSGEERPCLILASSQRIPPDIKEKIYGRMPFVSGKRENLAVMEIVEEKNSFSTGKPSAFSEFKTFHTIPLILLDRPIGFLGILFYEDHVLRPDDKEFLDIVATQVALFIENDRIKQAIANERNKLEIANRELEAFSYSVSHDLRAPLRHISGFAELLSSSTGANLNKEARHFLDTILQSVNQMGMLIDDLLSFSRMSRVEINCNQCDINGLVTDIIKELEPDTQNRRILWKVETLPKIYADASLVRMVLSNLISNAVKYSRPKEEALIEIGHAHEYAGETVIFVRDNGVGFDMQYADKLFGVFQRLHRSDEFEGTGIGLANVRRIIHRHGGRTWAEGKPGQGAVFYFSLPLSTKGEKS